MVLNIFYKLIF